MLNSSESGSSAFSGERKKAQVALLVTQTKNWGNLIKMNIYLTPDYFDLHILSELYLCCCKN